MKNHRFSRIWLGATLRYGMLFVTIVLLCTVPLLSQEDESCIEQLEVAESLYFAAEFERSIELIRNCIGSGAYQDTLQSEAYRLLCLSYIAEDAMGLAQQTARNLLLSDSTFTTDPTTDPREFIQLVDNMRLELYPVETEDGSNDGAVADGAGSSWRTWAIVGGGAVVGALAIILSRDDSGTTTEPGTFPDPPIRP